MHVAFVMMTGNAAFSGGVPSVVLERARYLVAQGHRASIVCRAARGLDRPEIREGIAIHPVSAAHRMIEASFARIHSVSPYFLRRLRRGLEAAHAQTPIDLVDMHDGPAILGTGPFCSAHGVPMIFTVNGTAVLDPGPRPWIGRKLHIWYERQAYRAANRVLSVSAFVAQVPCKLGLPNVPVVVVPNTVTERHFNLDRRADPQAEPFRLLALGRVAAGKSLQTTLRALALLPRGQFRLIVAGDGPEKRAMERLAVSLGIDRDVEWLGFVHDRARVAELIETSHAFAFPTLHEAFSIALLETMGAGLYPVASDIPAIREILPESYRVPVKDHVAFARHFAALAADRGRLATAATELRQIADHYRTGRVYPKLLAQYRAMLSGSAE